MLLAALVDGRWDITILATDIDAAALEAARRGVYSDVGAARDARRGCAAALPAGRAEALRAFAPDP